MSIHVEIVIRTPMDVLWRHTQTPALHEKWDLRFSCIEYLPGHDETGPQRFRYSTRIGFGLQIDGEGESSGERNLPDGSRSSSLKFVSASPLSIIREGSGYWKYMPTRDGIQFLTWYDYRTRFGAAGAVVDRWIFRPLIGWATAWSFDRLRLWLEQGVEPAHAARQSLVHGVARVALATIFAYQGVVPKLVARQTDEISMLRDAGIAPGASAAAVIAIGVLELLFGVSLLAAWHKRWPPALSIGLMAAATIAVGVNSPRYFEAAFNPFSLNVAVVCLAIVDLLSCDGLPSAARCRRQPTTETA
jgi:uncharacterized membrane protein YphA (DoxX/SURF4 family)